MVKIAVLASFNMDLVMRAERLPRPGETLQGDFARYLGGKGFNQAVAARRLGADVAVIGRVGADDFGAAFLDALDAEGIDRRGVSIDPERGTGVATIVVDADGENAIIQSPRANRALSAEDVRRAAAALDSASVALFQLELSDVAVYEYARLARDAGATVIFNPAPAAPTADAIVALAEIIVPNQIEATTLTGIEQPRGDGIELPRGDGIELPRGAGFQPASSIDCAYAAAEALRERGPAVAVITLGALGAVAVADGVRIHVPAFAVNVVDTVGAGDAFCAALAVRHAEGTALADAVRFATAAGAVACTRPGAEPAMPRRLDVEALLAIPESATRQGATS